MTFSSVVNTATTTATSGTSLALNMPASIVAGRLLLAFVGASNDITATGAISAWTPVVSQAGTSGSVKIFGKVAAGGDTATLTGLSSATSRPCVVVAQINNWSGVLASLGSATAASTADPPSLTMSTSDDYMWIAAIRAGTGTGVTVPTSYGGLVSASGAGGVGCVSIATRALTATTENPGAFGGSLSAPLIAATLAVPPVLAPANTGAAFLPFFA